LCYWIGLDHNRPAWNALQESLTLARAKKISWVNDLRIILSRPYVPVELDISGPLQISLIEETMKLVKLSMEAWIDNEIDTSSRTKDLLMGRLEFDSGSGKLVKNHSISGTIYASKHRTIVAH
jgi:hypothetical protein